MTVENTIKKNTYAGDDSTTVFPFSYPIIDEGQFTIQEINDTTGVVATQTIVTHYTVSGTGNTTGRTNYASGNITMVTAPATGVTLVIKRDMPFQQGTVYIVNDDFGAKTHEEALDELTMNDQQLSEEVGQSVKLPSSITTVDPEIATGTTIAGKYLQIDSAGTGWALTTLSVASGLGNIVEDTTPQAGGTLSMNSQQIRLSKGADVASATALTLGTDGNYFDITGTTTVTSIATLAAGTTVVLHFDGAVTLTHHATNLVLPGAANVTTAAGDEFTLVEYAAGTWRCIGYALATGKSIVESVTAASTTTFTNKTIDANGTGNSITNIDVADLANGTDGELITWDAAAAPTTVATGTSGQVLTSGGAGVAPTFQSTSSAGLVLLATATASTSTSIDFASSIDSTYDEYEIHIIQLDPSVDGVELFFRTSTDGGSNYDAGASNYNWVVLSRYDATDANTNSTGDTEISLTGTGAFIGTNAGEAASGVIKLYHPSDAAYTRISYNMAYSTSGAETVITTGTGMRLSAADVDAVRIIPASGTLITGEFKLYGVRKS